MEAKPVLRVNINVSRIIMESGQTRYVDEIIKYMEEKQGGKYTLRIEVTFNN